LNVHKIQHSLNNKNNFQITHKNESILNTNNSNADEYKNTDEHKNINLVCNSSTLIESKHFNIDKDIFQSQNKITLADKIAH